MKKENVAKLTDAERALLNAAATIGAIYENLALVTDAASAQIFAESLRGNAARVEALVMKPAQEIIGRIPA